MTYYPVIIPTLNRYQHFKECVESLAANTHADKTELVIGLDYPPSEKYVEGWKQIKEYIPTITGFAKVTVFEHEHNLGVSGPNNNYAFLRNYALSNYDAYISSEDDNVFSPCFLDYMNKCLEKYKDDEDILAISGYMNPVEYSGIGETSILRMQDYMAWGIGTWRRTWSVLDSSMPPHYMRYVCSHRSVLKKMKRHPRDLYQLIFWTKGNPSLDVRCDFTIACYCIINNVFVINPILSLVRNMGYDGSGVNCGILEDNYLAQQSISVQKTFVINDLLTKKESEQFRAVWEQWKCLNFTVNDRRRVMRYYWAYMILGYNVTEIAVRVYNTFFRILKKAYHSLWGGCYR